MGESEWKEQKYLYRSMYPIFLRTLWANVAFCRYIKVVNIETLIDSLCNVWIGRLRLHANVARFSRKDVGISSYTGVRAAKPNSFENNAQNGNYKFGEKKHKPDEPVKKHGNEARNKSYVYAVKKGTVNHDVEIENKPAIIVLASEGFENVTLKYMGGFWVLIEFLSLSAKDNFKSHVRIGSWFSILQQASYSFMLDERVAWVDIEGVPMKVKFIGFGLKRLEDDTDVEEVSETLFEQEHDENLESNDKNESMKGVQSEDPFKIYDLLEKMQKNCKTGAHSDETLKYPPGFTPRMETDTISNELDN
ncbi:hypothetical protein Tco_0404436 [Tanacetum coccineum]